MWRRSEPDTLTQAVRMGGSHEKEGLLSGNVLPDGVLPDDVLPGSTVSGDAPRGSLPPESATGTSPVPSGTFSRASPTGPLVSHEGHPCGDFSRFLSLHRELIRSLLRALTFPSGMDGIGPHRATEAFCYAGLCWFEGSLVGSYRNTRSHVQLPHLPTERLHPLMHGETPHLIYVPPEAPLEPNYWTHTQRIATETYSRGIVAIPLSSCGAPLAVTAALLPAGLDAQRALQQCSDVFPSMQLLAQSFIAHQQLLRWTDVTCHLKGFDGVCAVVDEATRTLLWVGSGEPDRVLERRVVQGREQLFQFLEQSSGHANHSLTAWPECDFVRIVNVTRRKLKTFDDHELAVVALQRN